MPNPFSVEQFMIDLEKRVAALERLRNGAIVTSSGYMSGDFEPTGDVIVAASAPQMTQQEILDAIYKWNGTVWAPDGFSGTTRVLRFKDNVTSNYVNAFLIMGTSALGTDPLLVFDQGLIAKKDIGVGGFISVNQGVLFLGHGLNSSTEPPKIELLHSGTAMGTYKTLYLAEANGTVPANFCLGTLYIGTSTDNTEGALDTILTRYSAGVVALNGGTGIYYANLNGTATVGKCIQILASDPPSPANGEEWLRSDL